MFIQTEPTPNPLTLKFSPGRDVLGSETAFFTSPESAQDSPLALALFAVPDVSAVFFGSDFITVTKKEEADWMALKPLLLTAMLDHFTQGRPVMGTPAPTGTEEEEGEDSEIIRQIRELIDTRVRPAVAMDGGDIVYRSFKDGIVRLELHGACSGCPSSTATLKNGIENMLKHYVPEVIAVEALA